MKSKIEAEPQHVCLKMNTSEILNLFLALYIMGNDVTNLASMAKLKAGRLARELGDSCLQYWGGMGFTSDILVSRFYR